MYKHDPPGYRRIFVRYIVKNGRRIYPRSGKCFSFLVPDDGAPRSR